MSKSDTKAKFDPSEPIRGWNRLGEAFDRDGSTVRSWKDRPGFPYRRAGNVYVFDYAKVKAWQEKEFSLIPQDVPLDDLDDEDAGDDGVVSQRHQTAQIRTARIRKLQLEADRLEREKQIQSGLYAPVAAFEDEMVKVLQRIRQTMQEQFNELLDLSDLSPGDKEKLQRRLIDGFNAACDSTGGEVD